MLGLFHSLNTQPSATLATLGFLLARYRYDLPTASVDTDGCNTLITNGYGQQVLTRLWDTSGRGKHATYPPLSAPVYDAVNGQGIYDGNQLEDTLDLGFTPTSFGLLTNAPVNGSTFMQIGSINQSITTLGNYTGALTNESYTVLVNNGPADYLATDATLAAGWHFIGHTVASTTTASIPGSNTDAGIYFDGVSQPLITGKKLATNLGTTIRFTGPSSGTGVRFSGRVKERIYYNTPLDAVKWQQLNTLVIR